MDLSDEELEECLEGYDDPEDLNIRSRRSEYPIFMSQLLSPVPLNKDTIAQHLSFPLFNLAGLANLEYSSQRMYDLLIVLKPLVHLPLLRFLCRMFLLR
ncbi:conserved hypothetical protein [Ricinus communis]|uniref:Uncharacterized protein n=1 Tax=Ricinus communis TaxID=3988 RepID=B9S7G2_RICCO|nr:conserved hypothetical protein [Ricinus communis]